MNVGKTKSQKMLLPEVTKLAKPLLVLPAINATRKQSFSAVKLLNLGDFNADILEKHMKRFCDNYNLQSLIKQPTCTLKIQSVLTNASGSFQSTRVLETGQSDIYLTTSTVMRKSFTKLQLRIINSNEKL